MVPQSQGGTSLFLALGGSTDIEQPLGRRWTFSAKVRADAGVAAVWSAGRTASSGPASGAFEAGVAFTSHPPAPAPGRSRAAATAPSPSPRPSAPGSTSASSPSPSRSPPTRAEMLLTITDGARRPRLGRQRRLHVRAPRRHAADPRLQPHLRLLERARLGARGQLLPSRRSRRSRGAPLTGAGNVGAPRLRRDDPGRPRLRPGHRARGRAAHQPRPGRGRAEGPDPPRDRARQLVQRPDRPGLLPASTSSGSQFVTRQRRAREPEPRLRRPAPRRQVPARHRRQHRDRGRSPAAAPILHDPDQGIYFGILDLAIRGGTTIQAIGLVATRQPGRQQGLLDARDPDRRARQPLPARHGLLPRGRRRHARAPPHLRRGGDAGGAADRAAAERAVPRRPGAPHAPRSCRRSRRCSRPAARATSFGLLVKIGWASPTLVAVRARA